MTEVEAARKPVSRVSAVLFPLYAGVMAWTLYRQANAWPNEGSWGFLLLLPSGPGVVFHGFRLLFEWGRGRALPHPWLVRIAAVPLGLVLIGLLVLRAEVRSMARFEEAHAPLVARIAAHLPDPCVADVRDPNRIEGLAAYDRSAVNAQPRGRLHHDARRFVLRYHGGSIDIDGSTVYYDSQVGQWRLFHNDNKESEAQIERLTEGLKECKVGPGSAD